ncbi:MAG: D-tyrosyl-tRNA(Tyr) deacylase [Ignavibacteria bacterium]|nr:D-tyrosyl-tRNA(Tyr) deacylase [Ignavibacteria bacterium]
MKAVVQRVTHASVAVGGTVVGSIHTGLLVLVGIANTDSLAEVNWMAKKILSLRIFPDSDGKMNCSVVDVEGGILLVSQFTLYGELKKGTRPSFIKAANPDLAEPLFNQLVETIASNTSVQVATGKFGEMMQVALENDGPVTIVLERHSSDIGPSMI